MLKHVVVRETRSLLGEWFVWSMVAVYLIFAVLAALNGRHWVTSAIELQEKAKLESRQEFSGYEQEFADLASGKLVPNDGEPYVRDIRDSYEIGFYAKVTEAIPPAPLWHLAAGQSDLYPSFYQINTRPRNELITFTKTGELRNPLMLAVGTFDVTFLIVYLFPLLAISLGFNIVSADRESGVLRMLLAQPVSIGTIVFGKLIPRFVILSALALAVPFLCYFIAAPNTGNDFFSRQEIILRLGLWGLVSVIYGAFWLVVCVAINTRHGSSTFNAISATFVWLVLAIFLPSASALIAEFLYPIPPRTVLTEEIRRIERISNDKEHQALQRKEFTDALRVEVAPRVISEREAILNDYASRYEINRRIEQLEDEIYQAQQNQQFVVRMSAFLAPPALVQSVLTEIAGTNTQRFQRFNKAVVNLHRRWFEYFSKKFVADEQVTFNEIKDFPKIEWTEQSFSEILLDHSGQLWNLLLMTNMFGVISFNWLRRTSGV